MLITSHMGRAAALTTCVKGAPLTTGAVPYGGVTLPLTAPLAGVRISLLRLSPPYYLTALLTGVRILTAPLTALLPYCASHCLTTLQRLSPV